MKCTPDELAKMDPDKVDGLSLVYSELMKKNPLMMFS